jgi:hypothetical protein
MVRWQTHRVPVPVPRCVRPAGGRGGRFCRMVLCGRMCMWGLCLQYLTEALSYVATTVWLGRGPLFLPRDPSLQHSLAVARASLLMFLSP